MKRDLILRALQSTVLAFLISAGGVFCVVTGFGFTDCNGTAVLLVCAVAALAGSIAFELRWGGPALSLVLLCAAAALWLGGTTQTQISSLLCRITTRFHGAYDWAVLGDSPEDPVELPLMVFGVLTALAVNWTVSTKRSVLYGVIPGLMALVCCVVVTDTVPDSLWLYLLILGETLLMLTASTRNSPDGENLAFYLAVPAALLAGALFLLAPRESYQVPDLPVRQMLVDRLQAMAGTSSGFTQTTGEASDRVDLRYLGPRHPEDEKIMQVTAPYNGTLYLRQRDYSTYTGTGWIAAENRQELLPGGQRELGDLEIETVHVLDTLFVPYYPAGWVALENGAVPNPEGMQHYLVPMALDPEITQWPDGQYRKLPTETFVWAREETGLLLDGGEDPAESARKIGAFVRSSAAYSLQAGGMSAEYEDFALWFLREADRGYCVHFATLATVLLRGAGIPARYVEGYMIQSVPGQPMQVTDRDAHAWTEYYDGSTWQILDATPGTGGAVAVPTVPRAETTEATERPTLSVETEPENIPSVVPLSPDAPEIPAESRWLPRAAKTLAVLVLAAAVIVLQSLLRQYRQQVAWKVGRPNRRALNRWVQVCRMAELLRVSVPEELQVLAQKAKFSQHTLTKEELAAFEQFRQTLEGKLRQQPLLRRLWLHIIAAI